MKETRQDKNIHFVLVAGFSADHMEALPLKHYLENIGFSATAISFYGPDPMDNFSKLTARQCVKNIADHITDMSRQHDQVFGIGISMGGALLLEYAKDHNRLSGIVSIGTPAKIRTAAKKWIAVGTFFLPVLNPFWNQLQKIRQLRLSPIAATPMTMNFFEKDLPKDLNLIKTPVLFLHSKKDQVSDYQIMESFCENICQAEKKLILFPNGNHVINNDPDLIMKHSLEFFKLN